MRYLTIFLITSITTAVVYFSLTLTLAPAPITAEYWVREMIVIKRSIAKKYDDQHKIVIVSGSNGLFSIDTKQLTDELKVPVINFGLHAGLSLKTLLSEAELATERGDSIIFAFESHYYCISEPSDWQVKNSIAWNHEVWESWSILDKIKAITLLKPVIILELVQAKIQEKLLPKSIEDRLAALDDNKILAKFTSSPKPVIFAYSAYNLDALGNMQKIEGSNFMGIPRSPETKIDLCPKSFHLLQNFISSMASKGVAVYFANTPYVETNNLNKEKIDDTSRQFKNEISQLGPMLDDKYPLVMNRALFFNSDLHLNTEGRKLRTKMLAHAILQDKTFLTRIQPPVKDDNNKR